MSFTAIFGGTFNPFHIGHYQILSSLCRQEFIDKVLVIPDNIPPHKDFNAEITNQDRINMCKIACEDFEMAEISLCEMERNGKSYTYETVMYLKEKYKDTEFACVCGGDMVLTLDSWYKFDKLKSLVTFIVFNRSNNPLFNEKVEQLKNIGAKIIVIDEEIVSVSSTDLRSNLKRELIPEKIYDYIIKKGLYNGRKD